MNSACNLQIIKYHKINSYFTLIQILAHNKCCIITNFSLNLKKKLMLDQFYTYIYIVNNLNIEFRKLLFF